MTPLRTAALALAAAAVAVAPGAALAKGGNDGVRVKGSCTAGSTSKLALKNDNGRIEMEFEVDQNRNGVRWSVVVLRGSSTAVSTKAVTRAPSGSFTVRRLTANGPGKDLFRARATSPSGEVCTVRASI